MKKGQKLWSREELILAMNLYCKLPFGRLHSRTPDVIELANLINRTPGSVAYKLVNFASLDPAQTERGIRGAKNVSILDREIWEEFYNNWDRLPFESEKLLAKLQNVSVEALNNILGDELPREGKERETFVKARVNQSFFRKTIMAAYDNSCCITGINQQELLIASHIIPWSVDESNRMNPRNGLALNALHDKAFEAGLITVMPDYRVRVSSRLLNHKGSDSVAYFAPYDGKPIISPKKFSPDPYFLAYHNTMRFIP